LFSLTQSTFASLGLAEPILRALAARNHTTPTPIQAASIPELLAGRDLLGIAQTGTGKTASFALPILHFLHNVPGRAAAFHTRALILAPTRELASQIEAEIRAYGAELKVSTCVILGGVGRRGQEERMRRGPDIVIGTPGRIRDLMSTRHLRLETVSHFVLDEADRMLDLGFLPEVRRIVAALPARRHSLLFSATMPAEVEVLANGFLRDPRRVEATPEVRTPERIAQHVHFTETAAKRALLTTLLDDAAMGRVIVFTRTKHGANKVAEHLVNAGIGADAIHGNKSQPQREKALDRFRTGRARVLVATDIAARGIDVSGITHVVNFDLPVEPEAYVHRIGRTARAGASGIAVSFCDPAERAHLKAIVKLTGVAPEPVGEVPGWAVGAEQVVAVAPRFRQGQRPRGPFEGPQGPGQAPGQAARRRRRRGRTGESGPARSAA
jgi:ATP-dependent RNA helicase RhlE